MECLAMPIDHRLRRLIREVRPIDTNGEDSDHIRTLHKFGTSLKIETTDYLTPSDLSFGIEMARPESKGGMVVVLQQPHSSQDNSKGFLEGKRNCLSVKAVSELIHATSNARFGFDDISVFDAIPFLDEEVAERGIIGKAQDVFVDMIRAKQPQIMISCFWTETDNNTVKNLRRRKIGCFKRLLVLEFVKAFSLWQGHWTDESWMAQLRRECQKQAEKLREAEGIHNPWKAHFVKGQWEDPLEALEASFKECFFGEHGFSLAEIAANHSNLLVESKITWLCCDIAWILDNQDIVVLDMSRQLLLQFEGWCQESWPETKLQRNFSGSNGYYDHSALLLLKSKQQGARARRLENTLYAFLRDLNLSYKWSQHQTESNKEAQRDIFRRFATAFKGILEEAHEKSTSREHDICGKLSSLNLNR
ncbi:hypothetical protein N7522_001768 [Penicillium canescens]|nr:hypothetical protein N7522_001768 [Penicillium canescens]